MGTQHFGLDPALLTALRQHLPLRTFVETGTYQAATTLAVAPLFDRVCTVELSRPLYERAVQKLAHLGHVEITHGPSPQVLQSLRPAFTESSVLYWLDAHWCGGNTAGVRNECPLLGELVGIGKLNDQSVVLIDDARYFVGPPPVPHDTKQWPGLLEIQGMLRRMSSQHRLWIINDVIIYAPSRIADAIVAYSRAHSVDLAPSARKPIPASNGQIMRELDKGFNWALAKQERAERIFAFHAKGLRIKRLLDIGGNSGQFAATLRRFGFEGAIYSVEPQRTAYETLLKNARSDMRWIPLARQAAGRAHGRLDLNLSENSWSSSFLPLHDNHLQAEPRTRTVARERVFVTKTADLLDESLMGKVDALKIDVQGYELEVLEGLRSHIYGIRLVLVEMSLVECYVGAPTLFALDRVLVEDLGFSRVSLEPSYYDDTKGVVQQFDGIYIRHPSAHAAASVDRPYAIVAIVTSIPDTSGLNDWLELCIESWLQFSDTIVSVSDVAPPDPRIRWVQTRARPSLAELFAAMPQDEGAHTLLCNADILAADDLKSLSAQLDPAAVYMARRVEVEFDEANPQLLDTKSPPQNGFGLFLLPPEFVRFVCKSRALSPEFRLGEPWWDHMLAVLALAGGFPLKQLPLDPPLALHHGHPMPDERELWLKHGEVFLTTLAPLAEKISPRQCDLVDDLLALSGPLPTRLTAASNMVLSRLP